MQDIEAYLEPEQIQALLKYADTDRDWLLLFMLWRTGRRISELLEVKVKDISFQRETIKFNILKKKSPLEKIKPIDSECLGAIKRYLSYQNIKPEEYLFKSPYKPFRHLSRQQVFRVIKKIAKRAGVYLPSGELPHPHTMRHSFAIHVVRNTQSKMALILVKDLLEHSDLKVTNVYLQHGIKDLKEDLEQIFNKDKQLQESLEKIKGQKDKILVIETKEDTK